MHDTRCSTRSKQGIARHRGGLPQRLAARLSEGCKSSRMGESLQFIVVQCRADGDIVDAVERRCRARRLDALPRFLSKAPDVTQPQTE